MHGFRWDYGIFFNIINRCKTSLKGAKEYPLNPIHSSHILINKRREEKKKPHLNVF